MPTNQDARALGRLYVFLAGAFAHPTDESYAVIEAGRLAEDLQAVAVSAPFPLKIQGVFSPTFPRDEFESEYINMFDLSAAGPPPCPLYESCHREDLDRSEIHEDVIRFWGYFGAGPRDDGVDYPDHLVAEIEFVALLLIREADALDAGKSPEPYRLAQFDFLKRHLGAWVGAFNEKVQTTTRERFYRAASFLLKDVVDSHLTFLRETAARMPHAATPEMSS